MTDPEKTELTPMECKQLAEKFAKFIELLNGEQEENDYNLVHLSVKLYEFIAEHLIEAYPERERAKISEDDKLEIIVHKILPRALKNWSIPALKKLREKVECMPRDDSSREPLLLGQYGYSWATLTDAVMTRTKELQYAQDVAKPLSLGNSSSEESIYAIILAILTDNPTKSLDKSLEKVNETYSALIRTVQEVAELLSLESPSLEEPIDAIIILAIQTHNPTKSIQQVADTYKNLTRTVKEVAELLSLENSSPEEPIDAAIILAILEPNPTDSPPQVADDNMRPKSQGVANAYLKLTRTEENTSASNWLTTDSGERISLLIQKIDPSSFLTKKIDLLKNKYYISDRQLESLTDLLYPQAPEAAIKLACEVATWMENLAEQYLNQESNTPARGFGASMTKLHAALERANTSSDLRMCAIAAKMILTIKINTLRYQYKINEDLLTSLAYFMQHATDKTVAIDLIDKFTSWTIDFAELEDQSAQTEKNIEDDRYLSYSRKYDDIKSYFERAHADLNTAENTSLADCLNTLERPFRIKCQINTLRHEYKCNKYFLDSVTDLTRYADDEQDETKKNAAITLVDESTSLMLKLIQRYKTKGSEYYRSRDYNSLIREFVPHVEKARNVLRSEEPKEKLALGAINVIWICLNTLFAFIPYYIKRSCTGSGLYTGPAEGRAKRLGHSVFSERGRRAYGEPNKGPSLNPFTCAMRIAKSS